MTMAKLTQEKPLSNKPHAFDFFVAPAFGAIATLSSPVSQPHAHESVHICKQKKIKQTYLCKENTLLFKVQHKFASLPIKEQENLSSCKKKGMSKNQDGETLHLKKIMENDRIDAREGKNVNRYVDSLTVQSPKP
jgi:hypothetical protein